MYSTVSLDSFCRHILFQLYLSVTLSHRPTSVQLSLSFVIHPYTVPPSIVDAKKSSTSDVIAQEGDTVTLWCMSSGTPTPQVTWYQCSRHNRHACSSLTDTGLSYRLSISSSCVDDSILGFRFYFLPRDATMLARSWESSFCPSVHLSVTRVLCDKTKQYTADILLPHEMAITLVF